MPTSCANHCPRAPPRAPTSDNAPTASRPQSPATACTEIAPPGSSTASLDSKRSTANGTSAPATAPTRIAAAGFRNAAPALLATKPAIHALATRDASGRPNRIRVTTVAVRPEAAAESVVFAAIRITRDGSTPLKRIAPAEFSPSHPSQANRQPSRTSTTLWAGIAAEVPFGEYFPERGLRIQVIDNAVSPPTTWMVPEPPPSTKPEPNP